MSRLLALTAAVLAVAGCTAGAGSGGGQLAVPWPDAGVGLQAVATVYPLAWTVEQVAPGADVAQLGGGGQEPHDLELSPGDRVLLERADVVAYLGDIGFQPQIEQAVRSSGGQVVSAAGVAGDRLLPVDGEEGAGVDPHLWFDPAIMADVALDLGDAFAAADPPGAERYAANARALRDAFLRLDGELDALLERCELDQVIVSHEAYAYLLEPHGLRQEGISGAGGHVEASPQRVVELAARVRAERIPAVLVEPVEGRADAEAVAAEAGVELVEIYSLDIVTGDQAAKGLTRLLLEQAQAVARVAHCAEPTGVAS